MTGVQTCALPIYTFRTGGIKGDLHQSNFEVVDEEEAYLLTAEIFAISTYRLLKDGAKAAKQRKEEYQPRFRSREEYVDFMNQFNKVEEG